MKEKDEDEPLALELRKLKGSIGENGQISKS